MQILDKKISHTILKHKFHKLQLNAFTILHIENHSKIISLDSVSKTPNPFPPNCLMNANF